VDGTLDAGDGVAWISRAQKISVQFDVDNERFMKMFYDLVTSGN
jgi:hypothetical protein